MNKLTAIVTSAALGATALSAQELQDISISTTFGWESEYIFRGQQLAEEIFTPAVDVSFGGAYLGIWAALPANHEYGNEVDVYGGYTFGLTEMMSMDVGLTYYTYPDAQDDLFDLYDNDDMDGANTLEAYVGLTFDVPAAPAIYAYYDFQLENFTLEGSVGHSFEVAEATTLDVSAFLGYVAADSDIADTDLDPDDNTYSITFSDENWAYYGASADIGYAFNEFASASIGVRYSGASEDLIGDDFVMVDGEPVQFYDDDSTFWWGFSVTTGF